MGLNKNQYRSDHAPATHSQIRIPLNPHGMPWIDRSVRLEQST